MDELQMLRDLPAVANVSKDRITYSNAFKQVCVIRYLAGESPTKIFREAGLPPELIGYRTKCGALEGCRPQIREW